MAGRVRINVKFGETKVLVPCGDGSITVNEMIEKAIDRFKKAKKLHEDDEVIVENLFQDGGSFVDKDDEVIDVFDDKETVMLVYKLIPHDAPPGFEPTIVDSTSPKDSSNSITSPSLAGNSYPSNNILPNRHSVSSPSPSLNISQSVSDDLINLQHTIPNTNYQSYSNTSGFSSQGSYSIERYQYRPSNHFSTSKEDLLTAGDVMNGGSGVRLDESGEFGSPETQHTMEETDLIGDGGILSQVVDDTPVSFSQDGLIPHSQVSVHSDEGSQPHQNNAQKFHNATPPSNYGNLLAPASHVDNFIDSQRSDLVSRRSSSQQSLNIQNSPGNVFNKEPPRFNFSNSQSMEHLNEYQQNRNISMQEPNVSPYHQQLQKNSTAFQGSSPNFVLSQEFPVVHNQQEGYYFTDPSMGGTYVMTQPEGQAWQRAPMHLQHHYRSQYEKQMMHSPQHRGQYHPIRGGQYQSRGEYPPGRGDYPPGRGDYPPGRGDYPPGRGDPFERGSSISENEFRSGPPPSQYNQNYMDKQRRTSVPTEYYDARGMGRTNQPPYPTSRNWSSDDDHYPQRPVYRSHDDDPTIDYALSQPVPYISYGPHYGRYPNYHMGVSQPMSINRGSMNGPSGYSLSQPGEARMRPTYGNSRQRPSVLKNINEGSLRERRLRSEGALRDSTFSIDEERFDDDPDMDENKPSPFTRSSRKSMRLDDRWGLWQETLDTMDFNDDYDDIPHYNGDASQKTGSPTPSGDGKEDEDEEDDIGKEHKLHIVELLRGTEPLGISLVSYTSQGKDLGVFIGEMDSEGFAATSGKLQVSDRILACNGEDFCKESNKRVEERFLDMATNEPLLRMAISRGLLLDLEQTPEDTKDNTENSSVSDTHTEIKPTGETSSPPTTSSTPLSTVVTNTRQLGIKIVIEILRGPKGTFGFGLTSRDVSTNDEDIPIYVKSIQSDGPAFHDGRLKIGDRILEVDGVSVKGLTQSQVIELLRKAKEKVVLVMSRQEYIESQDEFTDTSECTAGALPTSIGKTVMSLNIHLNNCGLAGLGVTVHCRSSKKKSGDVGVYIKSISPGGGAAQEGTLRVNDRILSVNGLSLAHMNNADALEALKRGLSQAKPGEDAKIQLTIARTTGINRKQSLSKSSFSSQMPALKEEKSEVETKEVGIDCPPDMREMSQEIDLDTTFEDEYNFSQVSAGSLTSYGETVSLSVGSFPGSQRPTHVDSSQKQHFEAGNDTGYQISKSNSRGVGSSPNSKRNSTKSYENPSQSLTDYGWSPKNNYHEKSVPKHSEMVSESSRTRHLKDRKHLEYVGNRGVEDSPMRHSSVSPDRLSWYTLESRNSSLDRGGSSNSPTAYTRSASVNSELSDRAILQHRMTPLSSSNTSLVYSHRGSLRRTISPPYDTLEGSPTQDRKTLRDPTHVTHHTFNPVDSPHTLPRCSTGRSSGKHSGRDSPTQDDTTSLMSYCSDSELNNPFQRDDITRISIPKQKNQPEHLNVFRLANPEPRLEGEGSPSPPLFRTGSDGDISIANSHYAQVDMLRGIAVGPNLRMAKSSSLESLQTVMHYTIHSEMKGDGNILRSRTTRSSFRRAVDRSYTQDSGEEIPSSAVISLTKSPQKGKSRKGLIGWIKEKKSKAKKRRSRVTSSVISGESLEEIAKQFGISEDKIRRMQSHSGQLEGDKEEHDEEFSSSSNSRAL